MVFPTGIKTGRTGNVFYENRKYANNVFNRKKTENGLPKIRPPFSKTFVENVAKGRLRG